MEGVLLPWHLSLLSSKIWRFCILRIPSIFCDLFDLRAIWGKIFKQEQDEYVRWTKKRKGKQFNMYYCIGTNGE